MSWRLFGKKDAPAPTEREQKGLFGRLFDGLSKSSNKLASDIAGAIVGKKLDQAALDALEDGLIRADLGAAAAARIVAQLANDRFGRDVTDDEVRTALADAVETIMKPREVMLDFANGPRPRVVLVIGVNGSGKTTTIGKLASQLTGAGGKVVIAAADTFRAAAIEQLRTWAERAGASFVSRAHGADSAGVAYEAVERARAEDADIVFIDTAGRLSNKTELMAELVKIVRVIRKLDDDAPHETLLVLDATVGQNALTQLEAFRSAADVTGLVMTKLDGTAKGGVLVAIAERHALPIHFIGVGEGAQDLQPFNAKSFARALVGLA